VDAFPDELFHRNPAAICFLDDWLDDILMQKIAMENNLSEAAFVVKKNNQFQIRWFTPLNEVALCGHATLATPYIMFNRYNYKKNIIIFNRRHSGILKVRRDRKYLTLDFPIQRIKKARPPDKLIECIGKAPIEIYKDKTDYLLVYQNEKEVQTIYPDFNVLSKIKIRGVIITAKGDYYDFVSRFFAPKLGVNEDAIKGSALTKLIPYWEKN